MLRRPKPERWAAIPSDSERRIFTLILKVECPSDHNTSGPGEDSGRGTKKGDQFVRIFVEVPTKLSSKQRKILQQFADETNEDVSPVTKGFIEKLRDLFE